MEELIENGNQEVGTDEVVKYLLVAVLIDEDNKRIFDIDFTDTMYQEFCEAEDQTLYLINLISIVYNFSIHEYRLIDHYLIDMKDPNFDKEVNQFIQSKFDEGYIWN